LQLHFFYLFIMRRRRDTPLQSHLSHRNLTKQAPQFACLASPSPEGNFDPVSPSPFVQQPARHKLAASISIFSLTLKEGAD
jgi:hypothetical protein